jgi:hypothetical protein
MKLLHQKVDLKSLIFSIVQTNMVILLGFNYDS